jgi:ubiquinone/menaquinone biosynthesis C-methylase UbiE
MATVNENINIWNKDHDWKRAGDEWSDDWGGTDSEWYFTILPRIHSYVPAGKILEIAPGFGRWTQYLKDLSGGLIAVDISEKCIDSCKQRFSTCSNIEYHVNNGTSLDMIADDSIDFVFSFDSLVHAEEDVIKAYLKQLSKKLKNNGAGFIHHSNIGQYKTFFSLNNKIIWRLPVAVKRLLCGLGILEDQDHLRAYSMTAEKFKLYAQEAGLECVSQEMIGWNTKRQIDCLSVFKKSGNRNAVTKVIRNTRFPQEIRYVRMLSPLYRDRVQE